MTKAKFVCIIGFVLGVLLVLLASSVGYNWNNHRKISLNKKQIYLRFADVMPSEYPSTLAAREFADIVKEKSNGTIRINVYDNGRLGEEKDVIEQVQFGGIDMARVSAANLMEYCKELKDIIPFSNWNQEQRLLEQLDNSLGSAAFSALQKEKFITLCWYRTGQRGIFNNKKTINNILDFKGLKIAVVPSQPIIDILSNYSSSPMPMDIREVYSSIKKGFVDGCEDSILSYYYLHNSELAGEITINNGFIIPDVVIASSMAMSRLSRENQNIMIQCAKESALLQRLECEKKEREILQKLVASGAKLTQFNMSQAVQNGVLKKEINEH